MTKVYINNNHRYSIMKLHKKTLFMIFLGLLFLSLIGSVYYGIIQEAFFFSSLPLLKVIPNETNEGDLSRLDFSASNLIEVPNSANYAYGAFINGLNICSGTKGTQNSNELFWSCPIEISKTNPGDNLIEIFHGYYTLSSGEQSKTVPSGLLSNYDGARAFDDYKNIRDGGKLFNQCLYGTLNGETYSSNDQRWYQYPLNTEWERLGGIRPGDSGGADCAGARCRTCSGYLSGATTYERKQLNLKVYESLYGCDIGEKQYNSCPSGTQYITKQCVNNQWHDVLYINDPCYVPIQNETENDCELVNLYSQEVFTDDYGNVIVYAKNLNTNECRPFINECVPESWIKVDSCEEPKKPYNKIPFYIALGIGVISILGILFTLRMKR